MEHLRETTDLAPHRPSGGGSVKKEEGVGSRDASTPGKWSCTHNTEIRQQLPEPSHRMALQSSGKKRARGLALTQAAVHLTPTALHGSQSTQANDSPSLLMLAGWRNTQPHSRPRQHKRAREAGTQRRKHSLSNRTVPKMVEAARGEGVTCAGEGPVLAGSCRQAIIHQAPKNLFHTIIPPQLPEAHEEEGEPADRPLHRCRRSRGTKGGLAKSSKPLRPFCR